MISWFARLLLVVSGTVAEWFVAPDALNFEVIQATVALLLFALMVFVLAFWPKSWSHRLNRLGGSSSG